MCDIACERNESIGQFGTVAMDLFTTSEIQRNILPQQGEAIYFGPILPAAESERLFNTLLRTIGWRRDEVIMFGKRITTRREVAWYGDSGKSYRYSGITRNPLPWTSDLLSLKNLVEKRSGETFNSCLLNLYHDGSEGMGWHSDDEKELLPHGAIASVSLGAARRFVFKHKNLDLPKPEILLDNGSLLLMKAQTQQHWLHRLPPSKKITTARINLTFRTIIH